MRGGLALQPSPGDAGADEEAFSYELLKSRFDRVDSDRDGFITRDEAIHLLMALGVQTSDAEAELQDLARASGGSPSFISHEDLKNRRTSSEVCLSYFLSDESSYFLRHCHLKGSSL